MMYGGIDPSSSYVGVAAVSGERGRIRPVWLGEPVILRGHPLDEWNRRLRAALEPPVALGVLRWRIEEPPPAAKADTGHVRQAPIGFGVGFPGGMAAAILFSLGATEVELVEPRIWRPSMLLVAALHGAVVVDPRSRVARAPPTARGEVRKVRRDGGEMVLGYTGCDHEVRAANLAALKRAPTRCAVCATGGPKPTDRARDIRDAWKMAACSFAEQLWPAEYAALRLSLRSRESTPDHRRAGLSDVCEAAAIAAHVWLENTPTRSST